MYGRTPTCMLSEEWHLLIQGQCVLRAINPWTTKLWGGEGSFGPPPLPHHRFSKRLQIKDEALAWKQLWISSLLSITKIKF